MNINVNRQNSHNERALNNYKTPQDEATKFIDVLKQKIKEPPKDQGEARNLGRWAMIRNGYNSAKIVSIKYADDSTVEDPIMCTLEGERVHINNVNPSDATELEMQMFCAHLDSTGRGTGSTFGTFSDLKTVRMIAQHNKMTTNEGLVLDGTELKTIRRNWTKLTKEVMKIVEGNDAKQFAILKKLFNGITEYGGSKSVDKYNI